MTTADPGMVGAPPPKRGISDKQTLVFAALFAILLVTVVTRFYRLGEPDRCYFDEVYFPTTAVEILKGDTTPGSSLGTRTLTRLCPRN